MKHVRPFLILCFCALILVDPRVSWAATTGLRIIVITPNNMPVKGVAFRIQTNVGNEQIITTDDAGNALLTPITERSAIIRGAADATGAALQMDANDASGGLRIPLMESGTQTISFYLDSGFLYAIPGDSSPPPTPTPAPGTISNSVPADSTMPTNRPLVASAQTAVAGAQVTATAIAQRIRTEENTTVSPSQARAIAAEITPSPSMVPPQSTQIPMSAPEATPSSNAGVYILGSLILLFVAIGTWLIIRRRGRIA